MADRDVVEFDCCECGVHVFALCLDRAPEPPLCCTCLHLPGWHRDPQLRAIYDPWRPADGPSAAADP